MKSKCREAGKKFGLTGMDYFRIWLGFALAWVVCDGAGGRGFFSFTAAEQSRVEQGKL